MDGTVPASTECRDDALINDWHVVAFTREIPSGSPTAVQLLGREIVVWRDASGAVHAWEDLCIHRGARLSRGHIKDGTLECPYHGWRYDGSGRCVHIPASPNTTPPARARAFAYRAVERYGMIWVCLGDPRNEIPLFPEWDMPGFRVFLVGPYHYRAAGYRAVENFIDATHFPFVHAGVNGVNDAPDPIDDYRVTQNENGLSTSEVRVFQPYGDHRQVPVNAGYSYRVYRPLVAYFSKRVEIAGSVDQPDLDTTDRFCTFLTAQPVDDVRSAIRTCIAINYGPELTEADIVRRQDIVYAQDKEIVESQRPERIPLELRSELHHYTDKLSVAYRRWLRDLGIQYGVV